MYDTNVKELKECRSTPNVSDLPCTTSQDPMSPSEYQYTTNQILYSYWMCFLHVCLRCVRRVRLTPATRDEMSFHPDIISPDQLGGNDKLSLEIKFKKIIFKKNYGCIHYFVIFCKILVLFTDPSHASFHLSKMEKGLNGTKGSQVDINAAPAPAPRPLVTMPTFQSFRIEGRVTTSCLWHACRAVTIGTIMIITGITMAILGKQVGMQDYHLLSLSCNVIFI